MVRRAVLSGSAACLVAALASATFAVSMALPGEAKAAAALTVKPTTWHVVGVRQNVSAAKKGPELFPVGARVCNTGDAAATDVRTRFYLAPDQTTGAGQGLDDGFNVDGAVTDSIGSLGVGACADTYFQIRMDQAQGSRGTSRAYFIEACNGACTSSTSSNSSNAFAKTTSPAKLYSESLVAQNRNVTRKVSGPGGCNFDYTQCDPAPTDLTIGEIYTYKLYASTSTAYEQLESFVTFPGSVFRVQSVSSGYQTPPRTIERPWSNACGWNPNYLAAADATCGFDPPAEFQPTGKAGRNVVTTYKVEVVGSGGGSLTSLIYDFSGSSFHFNADYGTNFVSDYTAKYPLTVNVGGTGSVTSNPAGIDCGSSSAACEESFSDGASVTLTASPSSGQTFTSASSACPGSGWTQTGEGTGIYTCTVTMSAARQATANFSGSTSYPLHVAVSGTGTVASSPGSISCTNAAEASCNGLFSSGTSVALSVTPGDGWQFAGWSGDCAGAGSCDLTMSTARDVTALFEPQPVVTRTLTATGLTFDADGLNITNGTLTSAAADGGGVDLACGATSCVGQYLNGAQVTVTATPKSGYRVASWGGDCASATISSTPTNPQTCSLTMSQNRAASATYVSTSVTTTNSLTAATTLSGTTTTVAGDVSSNVGGIVCGATTTDCVKSFTTGTEVTLTAVPKSGFRFNGWKDSGGSSDFTGCQGDNVDPRTSLTCGVIVDSDKTVKADFASIPNSYLQVNIGGEGSGGVKTASGSDINCESGQAGTSSSCSETFALNASVKLTATPDDGSNFAGFDATSCPSGTVGDSGTSCTLTMSAAREVNADFSLIELRSIAVEKDGTGTGGISGTVSNATDPDLGCDLNCTAKKQKSFLKGTSVTLSAIKSTSSRFLGWKKADGTASDICSQDPTTSTDCTVVLNTSKSVVAKFGAIHPLEVTKTGGGNGGIAASAANYAGEKPDVDSGDAKDSAKTKDYDQGETVTLTASPASGSRFKGWTGGGCSGSGTCEVTMSEAKSVTGEFGAITRLTGAKAGNGSGSLVSETNWASEKITCGDVPTPICQKQYDLDQTVTLTATAAEGSQFIGWSVAVDNTFTGTKAGGSGTGLFATIRSGFGLIGSITGSAAGPCSDSSTTCTVTMSEAKTVTATFTRNSYTLTVVISGASGGGTVTSSPTGINCGSECEETYGVGTIVTLTAVPDPGSEFSGWGSATGCDSIEGDSCLITITSDREVIVPFVRSGESDGTTLSLAISPARASLRGGDRISQRMTLRNVGENPAVDAFVFCEVCNRMVPVSAPGAGLTKDRISAFIVRTSAVLSASRPKLYWQVSRLEPGESANFKIQLRALRGKKKTSKCTYSAVADNAARVSEPVRFKIRAGRKLNPVSPTG